MAKGRKKGGDIGIPNRIPGSSERNLKSIGGWSFTPFFFKSLKNKDI